MADDRTQTTDQVPDDDFVPDANDPGGAHAKGYSADPKPDSSLPKRDPVPVVRKVPGELHRPEQDPALPATGRDEPGEYTPNKRLMGADR